MSIETQILEIKSQTRQIINLLNKPKPYWVKASTITELTSWDANKMRRAREQKLIEWKKTKEGFFYNLNSVHPYLIKK